MALNVSLASALLILGFPRETQAAVLTLAAGGTHTCALLSNGTVQCWGTNRSGQLGIGTTLGPETCSTVSCSTTPVSVAGITTATALAAGTNHTCALLADGTVQCWGSGFGATPVTITGITTATAIGAGSSHTCAVLADGTVRCWGRNTSGQLGDGTTTNSSTPVTVTGITNAIAVAAGGVFPGIGYTCALLADGTVQCWGTNSRGQLGNGTSTSSATPVPVTGITTAIAITAGERHTCALLANGTVQCWGENGGGNLGIGTTVGPQTCLSSPSCSTTPVSVAGITTAIAVAAMGVSSGLDHTCALLADGTVRCWGANLFGELGNGTVTSSAAAVPVTGITTATAVAAGGAHTCVVLTNGTVRCWGLNVEGQLGNGTNTGPETCVIYACSTTPVATASIFAIFEVVPPVAVTSPVSVISPVPLAAGFAHTCALLSDGTVRCWGSNSYSQLGTGTNTSSSSPVAVSGIFTATAISAGPYHTCALLLDGTVKCWGWNAAGQLGNGTTTASRIPVTVSGITTATQIAAGYNHTCVLTSNVRVKCWGSNLYGQLDTHTFTSSLTPVTVGFFTGSSELATATAIAAGERHTCALAAEGTVLCWGDNIHGQLGIDPGILGRSSGLINVTGTANVTALAAGGRHTCALLANGTANGTVQCWGDNIWGQLGNGTTTSSSSPVAVSGILSAAGVTAGNSYGCARLADGTARCWGQNGYGSLGNGTTTSSSSPVPVTGITNAIAVAAGGFHACALLSDGTVQCWGWNVEGQLGNGTFANSSIPISVSGIPAAGIGAITQTGMDVTVEPVDFTKGTTPVAVTFSNVTQAGTTSLTTKSTGPEPPAGYVPGTPPTYYVLATTAFFSGSVTVCIRYVGITFTNESRLGLFHFENGVWVDRTVSRDLSTKTICGSVTSLSPFAIFEPVDSTPPVIAPIVTPVPNANGWNNTDLAVSWSVIDPESGVASSVGCSSLMLTNETTGTQLTCTATNGAGLTGSVYVTVKIDKTRPTILATQTPLANVAGWNNTDVTVNFACSDTGSGIATCPGPATVTTEGASQVVTGTAVDVAGNTATTTHTVKLDKTRPAITASQTPSPNANGWNNTAVTVTFACSDALSGVATCSSPTTLNTEGANQSATGGAMDAAGNTATITRGVNIDTTSPLITLPTLQSVYFFNSLLPLSFSATDSLSGLASLTATFNGKPAQSGTTVQLTTVNVNTLTVSATDRADNAATRTASFVVCYQFGGFRAPLRTGGTYNAGRVIPVKFQLTDAAGALISTAKTTLMISREVADGSYGREQVAQFPGNANRNGLFRYDPEEGQYLFNWSTKDLPLGAWQLRVDLHDGCPRTFTVLLVRLGTDRFDAVEARPAPPAPTAVVTVTPGPAPPIMPSPPAPAVSGPPPTGITADLDGNGRVDGRDLSLLARAVGSRPGSPRWNLRADLNADGVVDRTDLQILRGQFAKRVARR